MDELNNEEQMHQELFDDFLKPQKKKSFFGFKRRNTFPQNRFTIILTYEKSLLILIVLIIVLILFFSLGVEKGKKIEFAKKIAQRPQLSGIGINNKNKPVSVSKNIETKNKPNVKQKAVVSETAKEPQEIYQQLDFNKSYTIQVVTYLKKDLVNRERTILKISGYDTFVIPSGEFFQICTGTYTTKNEALDDLRRLKRRYKDCFIRKHGKR